MIVVIIFIHQFYLGGLSKTVDEGVEIMFSSDFTLTAGSGDISIQLRVINNDWSPYVDFEEQGISVYYDGK